MLERCKHCGSAIPEDSVRCSRCGEKHERFIPPPISHAALDEVESLKAKSRRKEKLIGKIMSIIVLVFLVLSFVFALSGKAIMAISFMCSFILSIVLWIILVALDAAKIRQKEVSILYTQRPPEISEAEYKELIEDFLNSNK